MKFSSFLRRLAAVLFGLVLLLGGLLKLMDPIGSQLVVESYLGFCHLGFLRFASIHITFFFNLLECFVGAALIAGAWTSWIRWVSLGLMSFFTVLTALLLALNPPMDCGCFGELVHLTHLQSFLKNVVLLLLWVAAFVPTNKVDRHHIRRPIIVGFTFAVMVAFGIMSYRHLPMLDLTDLRAGTELAEGKVALLGADGEYHDDLALEGNVLLISVYEPSALTRRDLERIERTASLAREAGIRPIVAAARPQKAEDLPEGAFVSDRKTLMSLNRSNGGATFISDGQVVRKWSAGRVRPSSLERVLSADTTDLIAGRIVRGRMTFGLMSVVIFVLLLV
ncbi:MAG: hypothetical protein J6X39_04035 [Bacteroidales bacterium]|nr:hypothetical protein [Bacteroidales bacterium]